MLQLMILGGKALTACVWAAGIWAWASGDDSFFGQLMRILLLLTILGHLLMAIGFYLWGRKLGAATLANTIQVVLFGMFQVADVWLKRADGQKP